MDFYSPEYKLGIEADGSQHYKDESIERDEFRAKKLAKLGVRKIRFNDLDILNNIDGVCEAIQNALKEKG